jgi:23S rRNA pseudouridine955/2504/2580 synthase
LPEAAAKPLSARPVSDRDAAALERMVIYRDASVIAIDKPQGLPVQGGPGITRHVDGMLDALRFGYEERPRLVHRLDKDTSGVLILGRTGAAASRLAAQPGVAEAEINPLIIHAESQGVTVADAWVVPAFP